MGIEKSENSFCKKSCVELQYSSTLRSKFEWVESKIKQKFTSEIKFTTSHVCYHLC